MKVKIKGKELELFYSMRIYLIYEQITGNTLSLKDGYYTESENQLYSAILASIQHYQLDIQYKNNEKLNI